MREQHEVRLKITSMTMQPQEIEARIGLKPDESWKIGDRLGVFGAKAREHGFIVASGAPATASFPDTMTAMIRRLAPVAQRIGQLGEACVIEIVCTIHRKTGPLLTFERDDLRWIGVMGAKLRLDTFVTSDAPRAAAKPASGAPEAGAAKPEL
jgi:hypothetical protein